MEPKVASHRPVVGKLIVLIKRIVRKSIHWYVNPQLREMEHRLVGLGNRLDQMQKDRPDLGARLDQMQSDQSDQAEGYRNQLGSLHERLADLDNQGTTLHATLLGNLVALDSRRAAREAQWEARLSRLEQVIPSETQPPKQLIGQAPLGQPQQDEGAAGSEPILTRWHHWQFQGDDNLAGVQDRLQEWDQQPIIHQGEKPQQMDIPRTLGQMRQALGDLFDQVNQRRLHVPEPKMEDRNGNSLPTVCDMPARNHLATLQEFAEQIFNRLEHLERLTLCHPYVNPEFERSYPDPQDPERFDYHSFEHKFRGPSRLIQEKLSYYLPRFSKREVILDLGCGRGEFLEVLRNAGLEALGVEIDSRQAQECRRKNLAVIEQDLFTYLASCADASVDAIFCAQVIEHLPLPQLDQLFKVCRCKLKEGGIFIAETVNPHNPAAFRFFYMDPTHVAPLFPEFSQFLAESAGFRKVDILYPAPGDREQLYHDCGEYAVLGEK